MTREEARLINWPLGWTMLPGSEYAADLDIQASCEGRVFYGRASIALDSLSSDLGVLAGQLAAMRTKAVLELIMKMKAGLLPTEAAGG